MLLPASSVAVNVRVNVAAIVSPAVSSLLTSIVTSPQLSVAGRRQGQLVRALCSVVTMLSSGRRVSPVTSWLAEVVLLDSSVAVNVRTIV